MFALITNGRAWSSEPIVPSLDFLEYLAEGVSVDKEWIDPLLLQEMEEATAETGSPPQAATSPRQREPTR